MILEGVVSGAAVAAAPGLELGKGAIIGALLVGGAFLAGIAVLRKSAAAFCGLLMLLTGGAIQSIWLGVFPEPPQTVMLLLEGAFAAAGLIFLSATIRLASRSQLIGGLLFAGALSIIGVGIINFVLAGEASGVLSNGLALIGAAVVALTVLATMRGDLAARLILPGALLTVFAPLLFSVTSGAGVISLAPQALFAVGILTASLVALGDFGAVKARAPLIAETGAQFTSGARHSDYRAEHERNAALKVSENQLAQVLDYAGISVWDWNRGGGHQTGSFGAILGADNNGFFTPDALRHFIHHDDVARFDEKILGAKEGDGGYDETLMLHNGKRVRMRGARAVDSHGEIERIVVFIDEVTMSASPADKADALKMAAASLTGVAASAAKTPVAEIARPEEAPATRREFQTAPRVEIKMADAIERGDIVAAFQPIVCFESGKICGAEALARWPSGAADGAPRHTGDEVVREAQEAGMSAKLASVMMRATADHIAERVAAGERDYFGAFNVSLSQVREPGFVNEVKEAIAERRLPKGALVLELTEGEKLGDAPKINETFKKLKAAGAALAYDDFGAGFSSLSNLHKYDFDYLKIDKSFIDDIVANGGKKKIVAALARLGKDFGMTVIAEGVESKEAAEIAKAIGCKMGQGYHLGEPVMRAGVVVAPVMSDMADVGEPGDVQGTLAVDGTNESAASEEVIVLDKSLEASPSKGRIRRGLFTSRLR